jgi:hypothetical protein
MEATVESSLATATTKQLRNSVTKMVYTVLYLIPFEDDRGRVDEDVNFIGTIVGLCQELALLLGTNAPFHDLLVMLMKCADHLNTENGDDWYLVLTKVIELLYECFEKEQCSKWISQVGDKVVLFEVAYDFLMFQMSSYATDPEPDSSARYLNAWDNLTRVLSKNVRDYVPSHRRFFHDLLLKYDSDDLYYERLIEHLLDVGFIDVHMRDAQGNTLLMSIASRNHYIDSVMIDMLLKHNTDTYNQNYMQQTIVDILRHICTTERSTELIKKITHHRIEQKRLKIIHRVRFDRALLFIMHNPDFGHECLSSMMDDYRCTTQQEKQDCMREMQGRQPATLDQLKGHEANMRDLVSKLRNHALVTLLEEW